MWKKSGGGRKSVQEEPIFISFLPRRDAFSQTWSLVTKICHLMFVRCRLEYIQVTCYLNRALGILWHKYQVDLMKIFHKFSKFHWFWRMSLTWVKTITLMNLNFLSVQVLLINFYIKWYSCENWLIIQNCSVILYCPFVS